MIRVRCPKTSCHNQTSVNEVFLGRPVKCSKCGTQFLIRRPTPQEVTLWDAELKARRSPPPAPAPVAATAAAAFAAPDPLAESVRDVPQTVETELVEEAPETEVMDEETAAVEDETPFTPDEFRVWGQEAAEDAETSFTPSEFSLLHPDDETPEGETLTAETEYMAIAAAEEDAEDIATVHGFEIVGEDEAHSEVESVAAEYLMLGGEVEESPPVETAEKEPEPVPRRRGRRSS